jgi:mannose-6-phosphate isomerase-like protein (cupin superfamily)
MLLLAGPASPPAGALPSKAYRFEDLPVRVLGDNRVRDVFEGLTDQGWQVRLHQTELAPGSMPHPAHHHARIEVFLVRAGTVEVTIAGRPTQLGPGSVAYIAANDEHSIRNVGTARAQYFVFTLGQE